MNKSTTAAGLVFCATLVATQLSAEEEGFETEAEEEQIITIIGTKERLSRKGRLADVIEKTELISEETIDRKQAMTLTEAITNEPGIRVNNECSMCGMKRVMINGLKGEHTTVLVDGVPMHSVVSSYYGMDAITATGISEIEVARGAGASLIAPEAIGGTINLVTRNATRDLLQLNAAMHDDGDQMFSMLGTVVNKDKSLGLTTALQYQDIDQSDEDDNGVSENPAMENTSLMLKLNYEMNFHNNLQARYSYFESDVFGGPTGENWDTVIASEANVATPWGNFFENGDVREQFLANPWETAEMIQSDREEIMLRWIHEVDDDNHWQATYSRVDHGQDSFYEGFDYNNTDIIDFFDFKWTMTFGIDHLLTFGIDKKSEEMRSQSEALRILQAQDPEITGDSFDTDSQGFYIQDTWYVNDKLELNLAVRFDNLQTDWIEQTTVENEIDENLVTPRLHMRYDHGNDWTSRLSIGQGFRTPATFFESDHGILDDGFEIAVTDIEKSLSVSYGLSYEGEEFNSTISLAVSEIENLAFIDFENFERPHLVNAEDTMSVSTIDWVFGYEIDSEWSIDGALEFYNYERNYQQTFAVVPLEQRARLGIKYEKERWKATLDTTWIGSRDLADYGYQDRFNIFDDANGNNLVDDGELSALKSTNAKAFSMVNFKVSYKVNDSMSVYLGGKNLLDFTQVKDLDSTLYWQSDNGEPVYDVAHIYGPLKGREFYLGFKYGHGE
ncbi:TonB-dependent siderophore receptor [Aliikangiella sp. G2MR2-5]|uniref:TonB-dependent receptor plug domain-containing protein n=1 Tax=Aliikangiella sp. G2MR2-5 TaxID=2788943 RepID=UPI0018A96D24|nr:TonB-dependent receptor [Aliikangiella sp. G2MR2-5]